MVHGVPHNEGMAGRVCLMSQYEFKEGPIPKLGIGLEAFDPKASSCLPPLHLVM